MIFPVVIFDGVISEKVVPVTVPNLITFSGLKFDTLVLFRDIHREATYVLLGLKTIFG